MADRDRVQAAGDQLYAADPDEFTDRRKDLVAAARAAGDQEAARAIGALRRPTRAAWVVNQLARADPDAVSRLRRLGDDLRDAEQNLDGGRLRELSQARRDLLGQLTREALDQAGVSAPADSLEQEVTGTLGAAVADPQVAADVARGQLAKAVQPGGFGFGLGGDGEPAADRPPAPAAPPKPASPEPASPKPASPKPARPKRAGPSRAAEKRAAQERADRERAERARAELERQRRAIAEAEQTLAEADEAADAAHAAEADREEAVRRLEEQLEDAQDALADAKRRSREARTGQRQARKALDRLRGPAPG